MATLATRKLSEQFEDFLKTVTDKGGEYVYRSRISQLAGSGGKSLVVDYEDLLRYDDELAKKLIEEPDKTLESFRTAAFETLRSESPSYADHIARLLAVRIKGIQDRVPLRRVDTSHIEKMIAVSGMIVRTSELRPLMTEAAFVCEKGDLTYQKQQDDMLMKKPLMCETCDSRNLELDKKRSKFIDYQILRIQELPEELPPGQLPQFFDVNAEGDIVNSARPGDRVVLTGVMRAVPDYSPGQLRMRLFRSQIDCNHIEVIGKEPEQVQITKEDEALIRSVASRPDAYQKLIASIAPAITGHEPEREAILLLLAGGVATHLPDGTKLRGDVNVLFVGDPGTAKSEMLKFAAQVAPRGLFASGRGSTAAGLSAAVIREKNVFMLEAGVVVLADQGIACLTGDSEIYVGGSLTPIEKLWEHAAPLAVSASGDRELRSMHALVPTFEQKGKKDIRGVALRISRKYLSGKVVELTLSSGLKLKLTPEHLVRRRTVNPRWIRADQLREGDLVKTVGSLFGPNLRLTISDRQAYVLGCVYGDGYVTPRGVTISQSKANIDVVRHLESISPFHLSVYIKKERERQIGNYVLIERPVQLWSSDRNLLDLCYTLLKPSIDRMLMLDDEALAAFLAGVFDTDGDFNHFRQSIIALRMYPSRDEHELAIILHALRRFSVRANIRRTNRNFPLLQITGEDISRFLQVIRPYSVKAGRDYNSKISYNHKKKRLSRDAEKVVSVRTVDYEGNVYDLAIPDNHNFAASLIYLHNCIDEFDKMRPEDRSALHEQMEQQSYHPSTEILLTDGRKVEIGKFVDSLFASSDGKMLGKDCEILPVADYGVYTMTSVGSVATTPIARVSRHKAPENFAVIRYSNGRKIIVTQEHPLFVFRRGRLDTIPASEVAEGDFVPAPRALPSSSQDAGLRSVELSGRKNVTQVEALSPSLGRILGHLVTEGNFYEGSSAEVDFTNLNPAILQDMKSLMEKTFGIAPTLRSVDGIPGGLRYVSTTLLAWFRANFPELTTKARTKRVPCKVFGSSLTVVGQFLSCAFLGDGSVESEAVCFRTSSRLLAEDYQDLLAKVGIDSRINADRSNDSYKTYVAGHALPRFFREIVDDIDPRREVIERLVRRGERRNRNHDALPSDVGRAIIGLHDDLGIAYSGRFWSNLRDNAGITRKTVHWELSKLEPKLEFLNAILEGSEIPVRTLRKMAGWSQSQVARFCALPRRSVNYFERGGYASTERAKLEATLRAGLRQHLSEASKKIAELKELLALRFLRVRAVELVPNSDALRTEWVYDVTVEPTHNFVSSGVILHNSVTIAKGGIYATLNARTAILAAANPLLGKYNPFQNLTENIALPIPLLTRFDIIFIIKDTPTPAEDERLASHILAVHRKHGYNVPPPIEFSLLKKYIAYAKKISPTLTKESEERIKDFYLDLRRRGSADQIGATPRTLESLIRLATARARILLRDKVTEEDALSAIALMNKMVEDVLTDQETKTRADFGVLLGRPAGERGKLATAIEVLKRLEGTDKKPVERRVFKEELLKTTKFVDDEDAEKVIKSMFKEGLIYESKPGFFRRVGS